MSGSHGKIYNPFIQAKLKQHNLCGSSRRIVFPFFKNTRGLPFTIPTWPFTIPTWASVPPNRVIWFIPLAPDFIRPIILPSHALMGGGDRVPNSSTPRPSYRTVTISLPQDSLTAKGGIRMNEPPVGKLVSRCNYSETWKKCTRVRWSILDQ